MAEAPHIPANRITAILNGQRGVTTDTAHRLSRYFGTTPEFWLNLQKTWELRRAEIEAEDGRRADDRLTTAELFIFDAPRLDRLELDVVKVLLGRIA